jgi:hypothetical protein
MGLMLVGAGCVVLGLVVGVIVGLLTASAPWPPYRWRR